MQVEGYHAGLHIVDFMPHGEKHCFCPNGMRTVGQIGGAGGHVAHAYERRRALHAGERFLEAFQTAHETEFEILRPGELVGFGQPPKEIGGVPVERFTFHTVSLILRTLSPGHRARPKLARCP